MNCTQHVASYRFDRMGCRGKPGRTQKNYVLLDDYHHNTPRVPA